MELKTLIKQIDYEEIKGELPCEINGITDNSKEIEKGFLFICVKGEKTDGDKFIKEVENKGGVVIVSQKEVSTNLCTIIVKDIKKATAQIAKAFYGNPQEDIRIVGVVGTNGKTTICHVLSKLLTEGGYEVGVTGTIGTFYKGNTYSTSLTTPSCLSLYRLIYDMVKVGVEILVMEVSAHAIIQRRCEGIFFHSLIFTNCTEDHLDYFADFESYKRVKTSIFDGKKSSYMVINSDDEVGREILATASGKVITYGINNPADVFAIDVEENINGIKYVINLFDVIYDIKCELYGKVNVYNTLACASVAATFGVGGYQIEKALSKIKPIEGRAQLVASVKGCNVFVDYAHTPDGLYQTLTSMKNICSGKLYCVFGCGGNREKQKRPIMGKISGNIADFTIITSDNPRFEDECAIIRQIELGIKQTTYNYITIKDRKTAIRYALDKVKEGDVLVVAGKGAEEYQEVLGERRYFSDKKEILDYIKLTEG